jgi:hypothetical protein
MRGRQQLITRLLITAGLAVALLVALAGETLGATQHAGPWMIFAFDDRVQNDPTDDKHVQISGSTNAFDGDIKSNGDYHASGSNNIFDGIVRYYDVNVPGTNTYNAGTPAQEAFAATYPGTLAAFVVPTCDFGDFTADTDLVLTDASADGTYCRRDGKISIGDSNVTGVFTLLTQPTEVGKGLIEISGQNVTLSPDADGVLAYTTSTSDSAIEWKGSNGNGTGLFFAPNGHIDIEGSDGTFCMQFAALVVRIQGSTNDFGECVFQETSTSSSSTTTTDTSTTTTTTDTSTTTTEASSTQTTTTDTSTSTTTTTTDTSTTATDTSTTTTTTDTSTTTTEASSTQTTTTDTSTTTTETSSTQTTTTDTSTTTTETSSTQTTTTDTSTTATDTQTTTTTYTTVSDSTTTGTSTTTTGTETTGTTSSNTTTTDTTSTDTSSTVSDTSSTTDTTSSSTTSSDTTSTITDTSSTTDGTTTTAIETSSTQTTTLFNGAVEDVLRAATTQPSSAASFGLVFMAATLIVFAIMPASPARRRSAPTRPMAGLSQLEESPIGSRGLEPARPRPSERREKDGRYRRSILLVFAGVFFLALLQRLRRGSRR